MKLTLRITPSGYDSDTTSRACFSYRIVVVKDTQELGLVCLKPNQSAG
jgi:hypothetical protein